MSANKFRWLIWSNEHSAWWKENGNGYTKSRAEAGRFDWIDAFAEVSVPGKQTDLPEETLIPEAVR